MKIYLGSDHGGFDWKTDIFAYLSKHNYDVEDIGPEALNPDDDYPIFAQRATAKVLGSEDDDARAILICRGGQGMAIAANRFRGIRASVVWDANEAKMTRLDNDSNVLCLPADHIDKAEMEGIIETWLNTEFSQAPRHIRRLQEIDNFYPNA
ncbi:MAG: RpiB/LacA/LacB family sugar-phosphate isomerase [Candidatus Saccharimonadales bacterium]|nr:RpiB/LacA/LacB family sugar-phosphate isomerase [Candidatus Saccharimonadales bacterium]